MTKKLKKKKTQKNPYKANYIKILKVKITKKA
jgi:hypothetical protein